MQQFDLATADDDFAEEEEFGSLTGWILNFILGLLGCTIVGLAFFTLSPTDDRYHFNPWTYVVLIPVVLALLSAVLKSLVSRIVRRSMQAAFLVSVIAHLLIMTYFSNIVIHSRVWPQLFDTFAQQRQQLKREALQAKQYVKVSMNTQPSRRPDYMKYVPVDPSPTQSDTALPRDQQAIPGDYQKLPSHDAQHLKNYSEARLERSSGNSEANANQTVALSRNILSAKQPPALSSSLPSQPIYEIYQAEPALDASHSQARQDRTINRSAASGSSPSQLSPEPAEKLVDLAAVSIQRQTALQPTSPSLNAIASLPISNRDRSDATRKVQPISSPAVESESSPATLSASENLASRRSAAQRNTTAAELDSRSIESQPLSQSSSTQLLRRNNEQSVPNPSDGLSSLSLARSSAGGQSGPTSRSSLPTLGSLALASEPTSDGQQIASTQVTRTQSTGKQSMALAKLPTEGVPSAEQWDGAPSLSAGLASRSPTQLASDGQASAQTDNPAEQLGSGQTVQRAALGTAGPQGDYAVAQATIASVESSKSLLRADSGGSQMRRDRATGSVLPSTTFLDDRATIAEATGGQLSELPPATIDRKQSTQAESESGSPSIQSIRLDRSAEVAVGPALPKRQIEIPGISALDNSAKGLSELGPSGADGDRQTLRRTADRNSTAQIEIPLQLASSDSTAEIGAIASSDATAIVPRRVATEVSLNLPGLEKHDFQRSDLGGRLALGSSVALPTPAFQQRLDRLQNRSPDMIVDPRSEQAIERGLEFLAKYQREDGSWRLQDFDTEVLIRSDTAATALAVLSFQGAGYTHVQSKYAAQLTRAIEFLAKHQRPSGDLYIPQDPASDQNAWLYSHAIAALSLCEAYGMTQDEYLKPIAQRAVDFMVNSQDPRRGGWRYRPSSGTDASVTGWFMMALQSARLAGLNVPANTFESIRQFANRAKASDREPHLFRYNPYAPDTAEQRHGLQPTAVMTSVGLLIRLYIDGWRNDNQQMIDGTSYLLINFPQNGSKQQSLRDTYYWYYATQVLYHMGGDYWKRWHDRLNPMLIEQQVPTGRYAGSWDPQLPVPDLWARYGGRLYVTTMNLLSLEVSYRHLPLYGKREEVTSEKQ